MPQRSICCGHMTNGTDFPYDTEEFDLCLKNMVSFWNSPELQQPNLVAPTNIFYDKNTGNLVALVIHMASNIQYQNTFESGNSFYKKVNEWFDKQLLSAPSNSGLQSGFFTSNFWYYAIQEALQEGATLSTLVSTAMAAAVLLIMTCNICVTIIASFTIIAIVAAETGVLVLFGWTLGPIESIIFSVAVGMSIDFVSHLSHAFIHATPPSSKTSNCPQDQAWRVSEAFSLMGVSISTAATSTSIAGAMMLSCASIFFFEFGTFMVLVMCLSWSYSVFWLLSVFSLSEWNCKRKTEQNIENSLAHEEKRVSCEATTPSHRDNPKRYTRVRTRTHSEGEIVPHVSQKSDMGQSASSMQVVLEAEDSNHTNNDFSPLSINTSVVGEQLETNSSKSAKGGESYLVGEASFEAAVRGYQHVSDHEE